jgi:hypothetical protein
MSPRNGNSGEDIREHFSRDDRLNAIDRFYQEHGEDYPDAANDFLSQHPELWEFQ